MMKHKKWFGVLIVVAMLTVGAIGVANAQDKPPPPDGPREGLRERIAEPARLLLRAVSVASGLTPQEVLAQVQEGQTPAEILQANGADVEAVVTWLVSEQAARLNGAVVAGDMTREDADARLAEAETQIREALNGQLPLQAQQPREILAQDLINAVAEATGMTAQEVLAQTREQTLAEMVEAAGGSVDAIAAQVVATETEKINQAVADGELEQDRADELLANLETAVQNAMERTPRPDRRGDRPAQQLIREFADAVAEATGMEPRELLSAVREGKSPAEVIEEAGGDVDAIVAEVTASVGERLAQAVADGKLDQERADELLENLSERVEQFLNQVPPGGPGDAPPGNGGGQ